MIPLGGILLLVTIALCGALIGVFVRSLIERTLERNRRNRVKLAWGVLASLTSLSFVITIAVWIHWVLLVEPAITNNLMDVGVGPEIGIAVLTLTPPMVLLFFGSCCAGFKLRNSLLNSKLLSRMISKFISGDF